VKGPSPKDWNYWASREETVKAGFRPQSSKLALSTKQEALELVDDEEFMWRFFPRQVSNG
jgi:hypothetical protein